MKGTHFSLKFFWIALFSVLANLKAEATNDVTLTMQSAVTDVSGTLYLDVQFYIQTTNTSHELGTSLFVIDYNTSALSYSSLISAGAVFNSGAYAGISASVNGAGEAIAVTYVSGTGTAPGGSAPGSLIGTLRFLITDRSATPNLTWKTSVCAVFTDDVVPLSISATFTNPSNIIMGPLPVMDARIVLVTNNGSSYSAKIQVQSTTPSQHLGSATYMLTYNSSDLTFPASPSSGTDFSYSNFRGGNYATGTVTRPTAGNITITISLTGGTGTGTSISGGYLDVVTLNFTTANPAGNSNLAWNMNTSSTSTYNNASVTRLNNVANDSAIPFQQGNITGLNTTPLPVTLTGFSVKMINGLAQLQWTTFSEQNNDFFTIERSADSREFIPLFTKGGSGSSSSRIDYTAYDDNPLDGISYYRLKQTDFNGKSQTFYMLPLDNEDMKTFLIKSTNLGTDGFINYVMPASGTVKIKIINLNGTILTDERIEAVRGDNRFNINGTQGWKTGIYAVKLEYHGKTVASKMIKN